MAEIIDTPEVNITVHNAGGWTLPIGRFDEGGATIDISGREYRLRTATGLDQVCGADPENPQGKLATLSEAQVDTLVATVGLDGEVKYAIVDITANPDETLFFGRFVLKGW